MHCSLIGGIAVGDLLCFSCVVLCGGMCAAAEHAIAVGGPFFLFSPLAA